jgi:hypothetical protein
MSVWAGFFPSMEATLRQASDRSGHPSLVAIAFTASQRLPAGDRVFCGLLLNLVNGPSASVRDRQAAALSARKVVEVRDIIRGSTGFDSRWGHYSK